MALGLYPETADRRRTYERMVDEIAALGATHVALVPSWKQTDVRAVRIAPGADVTVPDRLLRRLIRRARKRGLRVILFPTLRLETLKPGEWRGTIQPDDWSAWWKSYDRFVRHYAKIAASEKAEVFVVGSELGSTERYRQRWYWLIGRTKRIYGGKIAYSANWDHYRQVSFWRRLDIFGVTGYFELTKDDAASVAELTRAWQKARDQILAFHQKLPGDQTPSLWLTEVGYINRDGAARQPWNYQLSSDPDLEEQRRCYQALRRTWRNVDRLRGIVIWQWVGDYSPAGKPAEKVLRAWWR